MLEPCTERDNKSGVRLDLEPQNSMWMFIYALGTTVGVVGLVSLVQEVFPHSQKLKFTTGVFGALVGFLVTTAVVVGTGLGHPYPISEDRRSWRRVFIELAANFFWR